MRVNPMMRTYMPALTIIVSLPGFCVQANAQAPKSWGLCHGIGGHASRW